MITDRNAEDSPFRNLTQTIQTDVAAVRSTATDYERQLETFVRERPVTAVLSALGFGFLVARLFSRR